MPKQKSHRGAAKRFSFTKSGIVRHKQMNANHQVRLKTPVTCGIPVLWTTLRKPGPFTSYCLTNKPIHRQGGKQTWHALRGPLTPIRVAAKL